MKPSLIDVLREIVDDTYICCDNKAVITLEEEDTTSCKPITIQKTAKIKQFLLLTADPKQADNLHPFLIKKEKTKGGNEHKNLCKKVDYLLFCELDTGAYHAFVIELKSDNADDWHRQARAGCAFTDYLVGFAEVREKAAYKVTTSCLLFSSKGTQPRALNRKPKLKQQEPTTYFKHKTYDYEYSRKLCGKRYFLASFLPQ